MGPGDTEHVVHHTVEETRVELGCEGGEVLFLIISRTLEIHRIVGSTAVSSPVIWIRDQRVDRRRWVGRVFVVSVAETDIELMVVVDVPVHTGHEFPVRGTERIALIPSRVVTVCIDQVRPDFVEERSRRTGHRTARSPAFAHHAVTFACDFARTRDIVGSVFEVDEEEELVLDNRAAEAHARSIAERPVHRQLSVGTYAVAPELFIGKVVVQGECPFVGTALGHGIDGTSGKARLAHIERSDVHGHLLQSVQ